MVCMWCGLVIIKGEEMVVYMYSYVMQCCMNVREELVFNVWRGVI
jgi:hypothetical protein